MRRALALACALLVSAHAWADEKSDAREAVRRGLQAFARGDALAALAEYETAQRLVPDANLPYRYAAEAYVRLERWPEAIKSFERYLALKPDVSDADEVRARLAELRAKYLDATVRLTSDPARADVFVDGSATAALATPATLTLRPGRHHFVFRASAHKDTALDLDVVGGQANDARVTLAPDAAPPPAPPPPRTPPLRTIGWITLGAGGAVLLTAALLDAIVLGKTIDDFRAAAQAGDPSAEDKKRSADTQRLVYGVTYAVGGALVVTGVVLLLWPQRSKAQANAGGFVYTF
jgi:tetratricopeptide (TPR) repeat protein